MAGPIQEVFATTLDQPVKLAAFEGPLDLLLYLVRKNEVDIYDIPVGEITRQYLAVLYNAETLKLEVAGDFFVMAATLMQIKSRMLLPVDQQGSDDADEEGPDPRWELVQQLLEYERFKKAALDLQSLITKAQDLVPRQFHPESAEEGERPVKPSDRMELWMMFNQVLRRLAERMVVGQIEDESITVSDRMEHILATLKERPRFLFSSLLPEGPLTQNLVVTTFLALLELTRLGKLALRQDEVFADIECLAIEEPQHELDLGLN